MKPHIYVQNGRWTARVVEGDIVHFHGGCYSPRAAYIGLQAYLFNQGIEVLMKHNRAAAKP